MRIFRSTPPSPFSSSWTFPVEGLLWTMKLTDLGCFILEERHPEKKTTSFHCVREEDGSRAWGPLLLEEPWWVGIEDVVNGVLFLHFYRKPDMPEHRGIVAIDMETGKELWRRDDMTFLAATKDALCAAQDRFQGRTFFRLALRNGETIEELGMESEVVNEMRDWMDARDLFEECRYPRSLVDTHLSPRGLEVLKAHIPPSKTISPPEVLEVEDFVLAGWHGLAPDSEGRQEYTQHFCVLNSRTGKETFRDILVQRTPMPNVDSFFLKGSRLFYVRNLQQLVAHEFSGGNSHENHQ